MHDNYNYYAMFPKPPEKQTKLPDHKRLLQIQHDVRSNLTVIKLVVKLLHKNFSQTKEVKQYLQKIDQRVDAIVEEIAKLR